MTVVRADPFQRITAINFPAFDGWTITTGAALSAADPWDEDTRLVGYLAAGVSGPAEDFTGAEQTGPSGSIEGDPLVINAGEENEYSIFPLASYTSNYQGAGPWPPGMSGGIYHLVGFENSPDLSAYLADKRIVGVEGSGFPYPLDFADADEIVDGGILWFMWYPLGGQFPEFDERAPFTIGPA